MNAIEIDNKLVEELVKKQIAVIASKNAQPKKPKYFYMRVTIKYTAISLYLIGRGFFRVCLSFFHIFFQIPKDSGYTESFAIIFTENQENILRIHKALKWRSEKVLFEKMARFENGKYLIDLEKGRNIFYLQDGDFVIIKRREGEIKIDISRANFNIYSKIFLLKMRVGLTTPLPSFLLRLLSFFPKPAQNLLKTRSKTCSNDVG